MPQRQVYNPQTGQLEWVEVPAGGPEPRYMVQTNPGAPVEGSQPGGMPAQTGPVPAEAPPSFLGLPATAAGAPDPALFGMTFARNQNGSLQWPWEGSRGPGPDTGSTIGREVQVQTQAPIDYGDPQISPTDQTFIDAMQGLIGNVGNATPPRAPTLPAAPTFEADPALGRLAEHAETRNAMVQGLLNELRQDLQQDDPAGRNKWLRLGEYLSALAADGRLENAGAIMSDMLQNDREMQRALRRETLALTLQGFGAEDAMIQAQTNLLSGQHSARERTTQAAYERDLGQAEVEADYGLRSFEYSQRAAGQQAALLAQLAEAQRDASQRAEDRQRTAIGAIAGLPGQARSAAAALAPEGFPSEATALLGQSMEQDQNAQGLLAHIMANQGQDANRLLAFYRQWDPSLRRQDLERLQQSPQALLYRLMNGTGAQAAFRANPNLVAFSRYGAMAPAQ